MPALSSLGVRALHPSLAEPERELEHAELPVAGSAGVADRRRPEQVPLGPPEML